MAETKSDKREAIRRAAVVRIVGTQGEMSAGCLTVMTPGVDPDEMMRRMASKLRASADDLEALADEWNATFPARRDEPALVDQRRPA